MIKIKLLSPAAKLPTRSFHSAGYDLYASETTDCPPGKVTMVPIGIASELPPGHAALVWDRSGMGKKGLTVFGGVGREVYRGYILQSRGGFWVGRKDLREKEGKPYLAPNLS